MENVVVQSGRSKAGKWDAVEGRLLCSGNMKGRGD
jgi:hypothetical protein